MIGFKQHIEEEFRGEGDSGIFKNPDREEFKTLKKDVRGWVNKDGDFYVGNRIEGVASFHAKLMMKGSFLYNNNQFKEHYVTLQRIGKTNGFALGETEPTSIELTYDKNKKRAKVIKILLKKARKNNSHIVFFVKNILQVDRS